MKKIPIYIASHFPNREMIKEILTATNNFGLPIEITSSWLYKKEAKSFQHDVGMDFRDIDRSQIVVVITPWYKGSMCETSYALGQDKPIIVLLDPLVDPDLVTLSPNRYSDYFPLAKFDYWDHELFAPGDIKSSKHHMIVWNMIQLKFALKMFVEALLGKKE